MVDPLTRLIDENPGWRGTFVEPVPWLFDRLASLRGGDERYRLVRAAITTYDGEVDITTIEDFDGRPEWATGAGTIEASTAALIAEKWPELGAHLSVVNVPAMTIPTLFGEDPVDLVQIDTEGHDAVIVRELLRYRRPSALMFEHALLDRRTRRRLMVTLIRNGYRFRQSATDTLAVRCF